MRCCGGLPVSDIDDEQHFETDSTPRISILEVLPDFAGEQHEGGWFPLHAAVLSGDRELVNMVLDCSEVDVNAVRKPASDDLDSATSADLRHELGTRVVDTDGATPLHYACMTGNIEIIRLLVDHGADFKAKDKKQRKPIDYFNLDKHLDAVAVYREMYDQWKENEEFFKGMSYSCFVHVARIDRVFALSSLRQV